MANCSTLRVQAVRVAVRAWSLTFRPGFNSEDKPPEELTLESGGVWVGFVSFSSFEEEKEANFIIFPLLELLPPPPLLPRKLVGKINKWPAKQVKEEKAFNSNDCTGRNASREKVGGNLESIQDDGAKSCKHYLCLAIIFGTGH